MTLSFFLSNEYAILRSIYTFISKLNIHENLVKIIFDFEK